MKRLLPYLCAAGIGIAGYCSGPTLAGWPWGKILQIAAFLVPAVVLLAGLIGAFFHLIDVGSAIIRIADKIAPEEKK